MNVVHNECKYAAFCEKSVGCDGCEYFNGTYYLFEYALKVRSCRTCVYDEQTVCFETDRPCKWCEDGDKYEEKDAPPDLEDKDFLKEVQEAVGDFTIK